MKKKSISLAFLVLIFTIGIVVKNTSVGQQQSGERAQDRGTLAWHVREARARGRQQVTISTPIPLLAAVSGIDNALSRFTVVIAEPLTMRTRAQDRSNLETWVKFRVLETLSQNPPECPACLSGVEPPVELLPLEENEILVPIAGGRLELDGVEIISRSDNFPELSTSRKYLLFLSLDSSRKLGMLHVGPYGVFTVNEANDVVEPIANQPHPLRADVENRHSNSLRRLREHIRSRSNNVR